MTHPSPRPVRVLITGGSAGIGAALAQIYSDNGADVLTLGRRLSAAHDLPYVSLDLSAADAVDQVEAALSNHGWDDFDILVLNAGIGHVGPTADTPVDVVETMMAVNVTNPLEMAHRLKPKITQRIVFVGSVATWSAHPDFAIYAATKAALRGAVNSWQIEQVGAEPLVQIIHPGPTESEMHDRAGLGPTPMRRLFTPAVTVAQAMKIAIEKGKAEVKFGILFTLRHAIFRRSK